MVCASAPDVFVVVCCSFSLVFERVAHPHSSPRRVDTVSAAMSSFPIVPRAGGDRALASSGGFSMPSLDLGKISFAAMGGSSEALHFPENDDAYDVDSSDEDLDGMEAAVAEFEERRRRREALDQAAAASRDAAEALERETRDAARAVANLRDQRRRFEAARAVSAASPIASRAGPGRDAIPSDDESEALAQLQARRARIDARIDALLRDTDHARARIQTGGEPAEAGVADENLARRAAAEVEATYVQPRWKQRQEERWAAEARAAVAEMEAFDAAATRGVSKATSRASDLFAAARAVHENDAETLRRLLASRAVSPDAADERGDTLLSLSCGLGRRGATKALLRAGADLNAKNAAGVAPVERCVEEGHFELADFLVKWAERHGVRMGDE